MRLASAKNIELESVQDRQSNRTNSKNSGWSAGVFVGYNGNSYGFGVEASGQIGKGKENSDSLQQRNTYINANHLELESQHDTNLKGAVVQGNNVTLTADNLNIESRQDSQTYHSKQTQAGASVSVAWGSGGSASANLSLNKAKMNYAQVEEQSGLRAGKEGINLNIANHTHLKGGLIDSQATTDKNHFSTNTLTSENIKNHSEVSVQSISAGSSTTGVNPMSLAASAISAMGNSHKNDQSTTQSAVSENIKIDSQQQIGELSRDTKNANQKVQQFDVAEYRERTEMAQVIAEISQNTVSIWLKPRLDEAEKQKAEAESIIKNANATQAQKEQATAQLRQANEVITNYGTGSNLQLAIRAVTGALQGIATGNAGAAVAGGLSPFANKAIKHLTEGNDTANLMAHAVLGAIEAQASGNNALAGATGAATGEATAQFITQYLYKKSANQLTESEKQTVSALSQFASGLAGATVGNSTQSAVAAMETGKRAVENNYLHSGEVESLVRELANAEK